MSCFCVIVLQATLRKSPLTPCREKSVINNNLLSNKPVSDFKGQQRYRGLLSSKPKSPCRFVVLHTKLQQSHMRQVKNINVTSKYAKNLSCFLLNKGVFWFAALQVYIVFILHQVKDFTASISSLFHFMGV